MGTPRIYCDGLHDDGPAIQAALNGWPYDDPQGLLEKRDGQLVLKATATIISHVSGSIPLNPKPEGEG